MKFAVVDIETTGLYHQGHGITEIAVVHIDGRESKLVFNRLLDPKRAIPKSITHITGIDNHTVAGADDFQDIAKDLEPFLKDRIFVAHNVNFDYNFLKASFEGLGMPFKYPRLCTMRYSRRVLTDLKSHRLKNVCAELGIENTDEHRAGGDANAAADVLLNLMNRDDLGVLENLLKQNTGNAIIPPGINPDQVKGLPQNSGVYYFYGASAKPIYIGKAKNLKNRVLSHFTASGSTRKKQIFQREITNIDFKQTANEYEALLLEDAEIKKHWPKYNRAQKERVSAFAVLPYKDQLDKTRLGILKTRDRSDALAWFNSHHEAKVWLFKELIEREINPQRAGMFCPDDFEISDTEEKIKEFIIDRELELKNSYVLVLDSLSKPTFGVVVKDGKYRGYGHFEDSELDIETVEEKMIIAPDSSVARSVIRKMLRDENVRKFDL